MCAAHCVALNPALTCLHYSLNWYRVCTVYLARSVKMNTFDSDSNAVFGDPLFREKIDAHGI